MPMTKPLGIKFSMSGRRTHRNFLDKLEEALNTQIELTLISGQSLNGLVKEVGTDYIVLDSKQGERWIRSRHIVLINAQKPAPQDAVQESPKASSPKKVAAQKPEFEPNIEFVPRDQAKIQRWSPRIAEADGKLYEELFKVSQSEASTEQLKSAIPQLQQLIDRHPANLELHGLLGLFGWKMRDAKLAQRGFFLAAVLGEGKGWLRYLHACFLEQDVGKACLALEFAYRRKAITSDPKLWRYFLRACAWVKDFSPLSEVLKAIQSRKSNEERNLFYDDVAWLAGATPPMSPKAFDDWRAAHQSGSSSPLSEKRLVLKIRSDKILSESKFADLEEDISGLIAEAETLSQNGKINSAFDKLNEGYRLVPGHERIRSAETKLRGPSRRLHDPFKISNVESTLKAIFSQHDFVVFDTSVLSMQNHFTNEDAKLDRFLRESGKHGLATLEEKVAYHKLFQRMIEKHDQKVFVTDGVVNEIQEGVKGMIDRKALQTFGKSAELLRRELASCSRNVVFDDHQLKKLRVLRSTFQKLRTKGGLSEVDYDLICRSFILAIGNKVALLSNDRGIHSGVAHIRSVVSGGNRNVLFLKKAHVEMYSSIQKSHFELVGI
jgi:hypothetical protein